MDYIIEELFKNGFKYETKKEANFLEGLKDDGFVYFDKASGLNKMRDGVIKEETNEDITLSIRPKINYLGLFPVVDNFVASLNPVRSKHVMIEFLGGDVNAEEKLNNKLGGLKLGQVFSLTALGYAKNENNEGYKLEVPSELESIMYKGNKICFMTTGLSKAGKEKDTKNLDFVGVRPAKILFKLGIGTSFGVYYSFEEYKKAGKVKIIDKATLK